MSVRRQLSLFVPEPERTVLDAVRRKFDPVQHRLIPAHATLCRGEEHAPWSAVVERLSDIESVELRFEVGTPTHDENGGVYLPMRNSTARFDTLRERLLGADCRAVTPHITLLHWRHASGSETALSEIRSETVPAAVTFREVSVIEQRDGAAWTVVGRYPGST